MSPRRISDLPDMLTEAIACCVISALGTMLVRQREEASRRRVEDERTRELAVELALHLHDRTPTDGDLRVPRRMVERILVLAQTLSADPADARAAALAAALPPGARADTRLPLPDGTRAALAYRHARWDGGGIVRDLPGGQVPMPAQLLAAADWLEVRDGASRDALVDAARYESGRVFSPPLARALVDAMDQLRSVTSADAHLGLRVTNGAMLCISPRDPESVPLPLRAPMLAVLEGKVRERLRPTDRVYCTDAEVVVWLASTGADGAERAAARLTPVIDRISVPSLTRTEVACRIGVAVADVDASSFTELLSIARARSQTADRVAAA